MNKPFALVQTRGKLISTLRNKMMEICCCKGLSVLCGKGLKSSNPSKVPQLVLQGLFFDSWEMNATPSHFPLQKCPATQP